MQNGKMGCGCGSAPNSRGRNGYSEDARRSQTELSEDRREDIRRRIEAFGRDAATTLPLDSPAHWGRANYLTTVRIIGPNGETLKLF